MSTASARPTPSASAISVAFVLDTVLILLFAVVGRSSHELELTPLGLLETAWPFLTGLAIAWMTLVVWKAPFSILRSGIPLWAGTLAIGMLLRLITGAGTALPFVFVATCTLCLLLVGWRVIAAAMRGMRARRH
ncbi:MAG: DUF3054 domain-containing protein [Leucobacter sp.]